jgi:hypothetical protein
MAGESATQRTAKIIAGGFPASDDANRTGELNCATSALRHHLVAVDFRGPVVAVAEAN